MENENIYVPSGVKTRDGKDIMCYTAEFYVKNKAKIDRIIKKCEEILMEDDEKEESKNAQDNSNSSKEDNKNILKENDQIFINGKIEENIIKVKSIIIY